MDIDWYVKELQEILTKLDETGLKWASSTMRIQAAIAILTERGKDRRLEHVEQIEKARTEEPASDAQIRYLIDLGFKIPPEGMTKKQASEAIKKLTGKP